MARIKCLCSTLMHIRVCVQANVCREGWHRANRNKRWQLTQFAFQLSRLALLKVVRIANAIKGNAGQPADETVASANKWTPLKAL